MQTGIASIALLESPGYGLDQGHGTEALAASLEDPMDGRHWRPLLGALALGVLSAAAVSCQGEGPQVAVAWDEVVRVSTTTPTLQVVVNPPLRRGTAVHDRAFAALKGLEADYVRYQAWLPYPRLGVAELKAPTDEKTSWDFSLIDPMTLDFLEATKGHPVTLNFSTIPQWMFETDEPVAYPDDPDQPLWNYTQGSEFRDPTFKEVADYYARLLAWYTQGGFTDELGQRHESGHRFTISHWEVLNEPDLERQLTPETYTRIYDAVVEAMRRVQPATRFGGISLARPGAQPAFFEYFLNPKNHNPGIPVDFITYHFYVVASVDQTPEPDTFFSQADGFLNVVRNVESIRQGLSPSTKTMINEIGTILAEDLRQFQPGYVFKPIPPFYWNLSGAVYAYLFGELTRLGIDVAGESQLVGYPTQFPSVSMVEWAHGVPNARYWVLKLLKDRLGAGDEIVPAEFRGSHSAVYALGFVKPDGRRRLLLVNKRDRPTSVVVAGAGGGQVDYVDQTTGFQPPATAGLASDTVTLNGLSVAVVTLP
jgi:hypothetical protein